MDIDSLDNSGDNLATFADLGLSSDAMKAVARLGYDEPTPVQIQAIPIVLEGHDIIAAASTGTGKTAAFVLPLLSKLARAGRGKRPPRVLVVTPTRELAQQIAYTCIKVARATGHFVTTVYGGTPYNRQINELRGGTDILIATPGRLCDLMERKVVDLAHIEALVLDEADRMLDMGFLPDVTKIVEALPSERQTLLFSATIDQSIQNNLGSLLKDPSIIQIARKGETAQTVAQYIMPIAQKAKPDLLKAVLDEKGHKRIIVFARTKARTEECCEMLVEAGYNAESIHSDKPQGKRRRTLDNFRKERTDILVATDVLARGIDVPDVDHVINYDLPDMAEDYIHRIGRTGRAGEQGYAISFVSASSRSLLADIEKLIGREIPVMPMETYQLDMALLKRSTKKGARKGSARDARTERSMRYAKSKAEGSGSRRGSRKSSPQDKNRSGNRKGERGGARANARGGNFDKYRPNGQGGTKRRNQGQDSNVRREKERLEAQGKQYGKAKGERHDKPQGKSYGKAQGKQYGKSQGKSYGKAQGKQYGTSRSNVQGNGRTGNGRGGNAKSNRKANQSKRSGSYNDVRAYGERKLRGKNKRHY